MHFLLLHAVSFRLGFINIGASCDKPLAEVLIGYGLLFLFGLVLEIMGMFRVDETKPMRK